MTWTPLAPRLTRTKFAAVRASTTRPGRYASILLLSLDTKAFPEVAFLRAGGPVAVLSGHGEHDGQLRIVPGDGFRLSRAAGRGGAAGWLVLPLPLPTGLVPGRRIGISCEHDYGDDWLEVTLPPWPRHAAPAEPVPPPHALPPGAKPAGTRLLTPDVVSHPDWASDRAKAAHAAAVKGGAA